jgi:hypothetical protein
MNNIDKLVERRNQIGLGMMYQDEEALKLGYGTASTKREIMEAQVELYDAMIELARVMFNLEQSNADLIEKFNNK